MLFSNTFSQIPIYSGKKSFLAKGKLFLLSDKILSVFDLSMYCFNSFLVLNKESPRVFNISEHLGEQEKLSCSAMEIYTETPLSTICLPSDIARRINASALSSEKINSFFSTDKELVLCSEDKLFYFHMSLSSPASFTFSYSEKSETVLFSLFSICFDILLLQFNNRVIKISFNYSKKEERKTFHVNISAIQKSLGKIDKCYFIEAGTKALLVNQTKDIFLLNANEKTLVDFNLDEFIGRYNPAVVLDSTKETLSTTFDSTNKNKKRKEIGTSTEKKKCLVGCSEGEFFSIFLTKLTKTGNFSSGKVSSEKEERPSFCADVLYKGNQLDKGAHLEFDIERTIRKFSLGVEEDFEIKNVLLLEEKELNNRQSAQKEGKDSSIIDPKKVYGLQFLVCFGSPNSMRTPSKQATMKALVFNLTFIASDNFRYFFSVNFIRCVDFPFYFKDFHKILKVSESRLFVIDEQNNFFLFDLKEAISNSREYSNMTLEQKSFNGGKFTLDQIKHLDSNSYILHNGESTLAVFDYLTKTYLDFIILDEYIESFFFLKEKGKLCLYVFGITKRYCLNFDISKGLVLKKVYENNSLHLERITEVRVDKNDKRCSGAEELPSFLILHADNKDFLIEKNMKAVSRFILKQKKSLSLLEKLTQREEPLSGCDSYLIGNILFLIQISISGRIKILYKMAAFWPQANRKDENRKLKNSTYEIENMSLLKEIDWKKHRGSIKIAVTPKESAYSEERTKCLISLSNGSALKFLRVFAAKDDSSSLCSELIKVNFKFKSPIIGVTFFSPNKLLCFDSDYCAFVFELKKLSEDVKISQALNLKKQRDSEDFLQTFLVARSNSLLFCSGTKGLLEIFEETSEKRKKEQLEGKIEAEKRRLDIEKTFKELNTGPKEQVYGMTKEEAIFKTCFLARDYKNLFKCLESFPNSFFENFNSNNWDFLSENDISFSLELLLKWQNKLVFWKLIILLEEIIKIFFKKQQKNGNSEISEDLRNYIKRAISFIERRKLFLGDLIK